MEHQRLFEGFELVSDLSVNFHKSKVHGINSKESFLETTFAFLSCSIGRLPFKFLGVSIGVNPRRKATSNTILDQFRIKLSVWRVRKLSIGGKVTLLNSVLNSLPIHLFYFFKATRVVINEIIKIQRAFLWGVGRRKEKD